MSVGNKVMKMKSIKFAFIHDRRKDEIIELRITFARNTHAYISTKIKVPKKYWNNNKEIVRRFFPSADTINAKLRQMKSDYVRTVEECQEHGIVLTKGSLSKTIREYKEKTTLDRPNTIQLPLQPQFELCSNDYITSVDICIDYYSTISSGFIQAIKTVDL